MNCKQTSCPKPDGSAQATLSAWPAKPDEALGYRWWLCGLIVMLLLTGFGCGGGADIPLPPPAVVENADGEDAARENLVSPSSTASDPSESPAPATALPQITDTPISAEDASAEKAGTSLDSVSPAQPLALVKPKSATDRGVFKPRREINESRAAHLGIRKLQSKHLTLYTDVPEETDPQIAELPEMFDQMLPIWCEFFGLDPNDYQQWQMRGFLMHDRSKFKETELIPADLPEFTNGFTRGHEFWMNTQTSDYYQRHLLLHEGTHGFMLTVWGAMGTAWYAEGVAELLATHRWENGTLTANYFPRSPAEVPRLGRIEMVQHDYSLGRGRLLDGVFQFPPNAHQQNESYGWCWAAATFFEKHPRYHERFRQLAYQASAKNFTEAIAALFQDDWTELNEEWQIFVAELDHNYSFDSTAIDFTPGKLLETATNFEVQAHLGWQNTGLQLQADTPYLLSATGEYQVNDTPKPWISRPNGVSIEYVRGQPLGKLLAVIRPEAGIAGGLSPFVQPIVVGDSLELTPTVSGTLYLRINDSPGSLDNNAGHAQVTITPQ